MFSNFSFETIFVTLIVSWNLVIGAIVYWQDKKSRIGQSFLLFTLSLTSWLGFAYLSEQVSDINLMLILSRLVSSSVMAFAISLFFFSTFFTKIYYTKKVSATILVIGICSVLLNVFTGLVFSDVTVHGTSFDIVNGSLYVPFVLMLLVPTILGIYNFFSKFKSSSQNEKRPIIYFFTGLIIFITSNVIFNVLIKQLTGSDDYYRFGNYSAVLFVSITAYAVIRSQLFNIKIIATQLLTYAIWIFLLIQIIIADSVQQVIVNLVLLIIIIFFGIFLIRSVLKEVSQREKIELLAQDLEKANVRLTELDRQKSEFVSFATHQLRAPLTAMKGYASMMLEGDMGKIPDEAFKGVSRIYDSSKTLTSIVDDYLNLTRIELGTMKYAFETIDLKALVEDTVGELEPNIEKSGLKFSFNADKNGNDYRITADRDKLKQVIANLIDNSMKYTPSGSIDVSLKYDSPKHAYIFQVKDTGIGIASEVLPKLFQKWSRASNANKTNIKGTGLGLFVAKQILDAHHAKISVESPGEGKGSTFKVEFEPFKKA